MKNLVQFLLESSNTQITLTWFVNTLATMQGKDPDTQVAFICKEAGISDYIDSREFKELKDAIQEYFAALDKFLTQERELKASISDWKTRYSYATTHYYYNVSDAYKNAYYNVLCKLINKYKGGKVSESILEAKEGLTPMENALEIALQWKNKESDIDDKELSDAVIYWAIVYALEDEGNAWAKTMIERVNAWRASKREPEKIAKDITGSAEYKMIMTGMSKIFDQYNNLQEILDTLLEPVDDEDDPSEWTLPASDQKLYDSQLKKLEKMKKDFISKCKAIK